MFTPLPPARTGTADYAAQLIDELRKLVNLHVFEGARRINEKSFDAVIYQIANNPYHAGIYDMAIQHPGISVLHEVNLHDLIKGQTLNYGNRRAYLRKVMYEVYGEGLEDPGRGDLFEVPQPRTFTMLRQLLDRSQRCIAHSTSAERGLRQKGFSGPVAIIPHGSSVRNLDSAACRRAIGAGSAVPLIGLFGFQRPDKRGLECFRAFEALLSSCPSAEFLVVGEPHPEVPLRRWIALAKLERRVHVMGYLATTEAYDQHLAACDIILNLRHPTFGETSGTMMRAFGLGKTVIVSDAGACRDLPDDVCIRIPPDDYEAVVLVECVKWLIEAPSRIDEIGRRAQQWVGESCAWPKVAQMYAAFARDAAGGAPAGNGNHRLPAVPAPIVTQPLSAQTAEAYLRRWIAPESDSARYFRTHANRLARTLQRIPHGGKEDRVLEMGCYLQVTPALRNLLGYGEVRGCYLGKPGESARRSTVSNDGEQFECFIDLFGADVDPFPYPDGYFSTVLCCELLEHLENDPMHMMSEIYRVLKPGGILVLSTPNIVSLQSIAQVLKGAHPASFRRYARSRFGADPEPGHSREYTPDEIRLLLADSGFIVLSVETIPYGETELEDPQWVLPILRSVRRPTALRDDCILALGRKDSIPRKRFPEWLFGE
jgi:SAM-dependent methyltransferase/glycosyltransferase involved in cell wall biosynthesis